MPDPAEAVLPQQDQDAPSDQAADLQPEVEAPEAKPDLDYKAELDKERAESARWRKEATDLRANDLGALREFERGTAAEELRDMFEERFTSLENAVSSGDTEGYASKAAAARAKTAEAVLEKAHLAGSTETANTIVAIAAEIGIDPNTHEAFDPARRYFRSSQQVLKSNRPDAALMAGRLLGKAEAEAERAKQKVLSGRHAEEVKKAREDGERGARRSAERANAADLSTGPGGGGGPTVTRDNIDKLYVDYDREHPDSPNPYEIRYRSLLRSGRM